MIQNLENAYNWYRKDMSGVNVRLHPGFSPEAALAIAVTLCSLNPARVAKKEAELGRIEPGFIGNAVLIRIVEDPQRKKRHILKIERVFVGQ